MFEDREHAFEAQFVHGLELDFQAHARRNRLFGEWVARRRGLEAEAARRYAADLALEDFPHYRAAPVLQRAASDLARAGLRLSDGELAAALADSAARAQAEIWADAWPSG